MKKSIPIILTLGIGIVAGVVLSNPSLVKNAYDGLSGLNNVSQAPDKTPPPTAQAEDPQDLIAQLLASEDVQAMIRSFMADPKIDVKAISELVAKQVAESPELRQALADQLRSQEVRKIMSEMVRSPDFQQAVKEILQSKDFRLLYQDMVNEVLKTTGH